jgi:hypothetical protein
MPKLRIHRDIAFVGLDDKRICGRWEVLPLSGVGQWCTASVHRLLGSRATNHFVHVPMVWSDMLPRRVDLTCPAFSNRRCLGSNVQTHDNGRVHAKDAAYGLTRLHSEAAECAVISLRLCVRWRLLQP